MSKVVMTINSKLFSISCDDLVLRFEFYTKEYIENKLKKITGITVESVLVEPRKTPSRLRTIYLDDDGFKKYHYFAYIKFFEYEGKKYGLVAGKTNYLNHDIRFDELTGKKDNRFARIFLKQSGLKWDNEVLIINHAPRKNTDTSADETELLQHDELQAKFIERYLQRKFNLFDS